MRYHKKNRCFRVPAFARLLTAALLALILVSAPAGAAAQKKEIIVSAAASLTPSMQAMEKAFEDCHRRVNVTLNLASSGALLQQMAQGAPVDVFLSANQAFMDQAERKGLIRPATRRDFASNTLVLAVPAGNPAGVQIAADLGRKGVARIAMGDPGSVPAGRYAKQALSSLGLWAPLSEKLIYGNSVRQVLDYLRRSEVDAGLVYATDARSAVGAVATIGALPTKDPIVYCLAVAADSPEAEAAESFIRFVLGKEGQDILADFGFTRIEADGK